MDERRRAQDERGPDTRRRQRRRHRRVRRVWVQNVDVNVKTLYARLDALAARRTALAANLQHRRGRRRSAALELDLAAEQALDRHARILLARAHEAAHRKYPVPNRVANWFGGRLIEAAYQNLHAAEGVAAGLYDWDEIRSEAPEAVARIEAGLQRDDPRRSAVDLLTPQRLDELSLAEARAQLTKAIEVGHAAADREHSRLRVFRNAVLMAGICLAIFLFTFGLYVWYHPSYVPLCFTPPNAEGDPPTWVCPTGEYVWDPPTPTNPGPTESHDIVVVFMLGLIGGALSAAISIRGMPGTPTPYSVPFALAVLKVPLGALMAFGGLIALQGDFVPGLSELDSQGQILAYALVFGYAQQLLSGVLDRKAKSLQESAPGKEKEVHYTRRAAPRATRTSTAVIPRRRPAPDPRR
jgi:hypothetical protein